eukprot:TRINITY_DN2010_c0_g1_i6.p2 TRINITY_DN2010_c0_g1~~TRINITY_DN2010_c0_g1_i6.p2  ORF type:complete len:182 (-),score=16.52 TRINITY_DN2010_c0_g1_i6:204-749(-)
MGYRGSPFLRNVKMRYYYNTDTELLEGMVKFPTDCEGPIGAVHGGCLAAALDNVLGYQSLRSVGLGCVTLNLNVNYRAFTPLGACVRFETKRDRVEGRKVYCSARFRSLDGETVHVEATALFYKTSERMLGYDDAKKLFGSQSNMTKQQFLNYLEERRKRRSKTAGSAAVASGKPRMKPKL